MLATQQSRALTHRRSTVHTPPMTAKRYYYDTRVEAVSAGWTQRSYIENVKPENRAVQPKTSRKNVTSTSTHKILLPPDSCFFTASHQLAVHCFSPGHTVDDSFKHLSTKSKFLARATLSYTLTENLSMFYQGFSSWSHVTPGRPAFHSARQPSGFFEIADRPHVVTTAPVSPLTMTRVGNAWTPKDVAALSRLDGGSKGRRTKPLPAAKSRISFSL